MRRARLTLRACRTTIVQAIEAADGCVLSVQTFEYPPTETGGRCVLIKELRAGSGEPTRSWWRSDVHMIDIE
jgi:hypothetical protein